MYLQKQFPGKELEFMLIFIFHFLGSLDKTFPLSDVKYCSCLLNLFPFLLFIPFPPFYSPSMDLAEIKYSLGLPW